ncbi:hypothetical protein AMTRI_Chr07g81990 [Amborella trichopoda]
MELTRVQTLFYSFPSSKFRGTSSNSPSPFPSRISLLFRWSLPPANFVAAFSFLPISSRFRAKNFLRCSTMDDDENPNDIWQAFSMLSPDIPWDKGSTWSTLAVYILTLHIPLGYGGLFMVKQILHLNDLSPQTKALSLIVTQTLELLGVCVILKYTANGCFKLSDFFEDSKERDWIKVSALGSGFLISLALLTSLLADIVVGPKAVNNDMMKEVLESGPISLCACFLVYCFITPFLEEIVYRGFLLNSIASTTNWTQAVVISACAFSAVHFSIENSLQLFIIGCVLGCSYVWTGNLASSFTIHSLYNTIILLITLLS